MHLATLVHDDSVDHSALRRGMPTVNSLFSHQVSVIMGDFLYSRAVVELVRANDMEVLRVLSDATNAMTVGEMRQLTAIDALGFTEDDYEALIRSKTASLLVRRVRDRRAGGRALAAARRWRATASGSAWRSRLRTIFSTTLRTSVSPVSRAGSTCASTR